MSENDGADRAPRRDTLRTHGVLLDAAGALLRRQGTTFTLPDLARESGVSTATTYRHFDDVHAVFDAYYRRTIGELVELLASLGRSDNAMVAFDGICREWVMGAVGWGRAATHIRSARGYIERVREADDPLLLDLYGTLSGTIEGLVAMEAIPTVDVEYAVLLWTTIFDERVVVDLHEAMGWSPARISATLGDTVLSAWGRR